MTKITGGDGSHETQMYLRSKNPLDCQPAVTTNKQPLGSLLGNHSGITSLWMVTWLSCPVHSFTSKHIHLSRAETLGKVNILRTTGKRPQCWCSSEGQHSVDCRLDLRYLCNVYVQHWKSVLTNNMNKTKYNAGASVFAAGSQIEETIMRLHTFFQYISHFIFHAAHFIFRMCVQPVNI